jgi:biotin transporter BioY
MRRVSWECTRFMSMSRGSLKAFKMASFVISWNTARYINSSKEFSRLYQFGLEALDVLYLVGNLWRQNFCEMP